MAICFDAIGEKYTTFLAGETAEAGKVCKVSENDTVDLCTEGEAFCGVIAEVRGGCAAVVTDGYVELPYSGTAPAVGYAALGANAEGGVKSVTSGGRSCLVVHVDTAAMTVGLFL